MNSGIHACFNALEDFVLKQKKEMNTDSESVKRLLCYVRPMFCSIQTAVCRPIDSIYNNLILNHVKVII